MGHNQWGNKTNVKNLIKFVIFQPNLVFQTNLKIISSPTMAQESRNLMCIMQAVQGNLIPRLSSVRSSLEEKMNAGHMVPRFSEPFGYLLLVRGALFVIWIKVTCVKLFFNCKTKTTYINKYYPPSLKSWLLKSGST